MNIGDLCVFRVRFDKRTPEVEEKARYLMTLHAKEAGHASPEDITWEWVEPLVLQSTFPYKSKHRYACVICGAPQILS